MIINKSWFSKWYVFVCIGVSILLAIIVLVNVIDHSTKVSKELEDFSIDRLSSEDISNNEYASVFAVSRKYESGTRTGANGASKYEDTDRIDFKCKKMTGIMRVSATKSSNCTLTINVSSKLLSGKAKIVVICDDEILEYVDFGQEKTLTYDVIGEHIYSVKILAEEAELEIIVEREINVK